MEIDKEMQKSQLRSIVDFLTIIIRERYESYSFFTIFEKTWGS